MPPASVTLSTTRSTAALFSLSFFTTSTIHRRSAGDTWARAWMSGRVSFFSLMSMPVGLPVSMPVP